MSVSAQRRRVGRALEELGLLLVTDNALPSVARMIAGEPIRGSWWAHPAGAAIFTTCEWLEARDDVITAKLVNGKVTFVQRRLWGAFLRVATSRRAWQRRGMSRAARRLLAEVGRRGRVRTDGLKQPARALRQPVQELERRLLVRSGSVHTEHGKHVKELESWRAWMRRSGFVATLPPWSTACAALEEAGAALLAAAGRGGAGGGAGVRVCFPWQD